MPRVRLVYNLLIDDSLRFFLTGEPTNELGVSHDSDLASDAGLLSIVGERTFGSLLIGCKTDRLLWASGVDSSGDGGDRRFRSAALVSLVPDSEYIGDLSIRSDAVIGGEGGSGESTVEISTSIFIPAFSTRFIGTPKIDYRETQFRNCFDSHSDVNKWDRTF